jgi:hypothetical protein
MRNNVRYVRGVLVNPETNQILLRSVARLENQNNTGVKMRSSLVAELLTHMKRSKTFEWLLKVDNVLAR